MGKEALSKNGLVLVVGTDGTKVTWARVTTGMPSGNEGLTQDARSALTGVAFTPDTLLGAPVGHLANGKVTITHGQGAFENLVWSPANGFIRQCMACKSKGDTGISFSYLGGDIQPNSGQKFWIEFMAGFAAAAMWAVFVFVNPVNRKRRGASPFSDFRFNPFSSSSEDA
jgi:hypothetical protein